MIRIIWAGLCVPGPTSLPPRCPHVLVLMMSARELATFRILLTGQFPASKQIVSCTFHPLSIFIGDECQQNENGHGLKPCACVTLPIYSSFLYGFWHFYRSWTCACFDHYVTHKYGKQRDIAIMIGSAIV